MKKGFILRHGMYQTKLYRIWSHMIQRCTNQKSDSYPRYGGRGITICDEWRNDFTCFLAWARSSGYVEPLSIERIDVNGNYEPSNCKWIPLKDQYWNTRRNIGIEKARLVRSKFPSMNAFQISKELKISHNTVLRIIRQESYKES